MTTYGTIPIEPVPALNLHYTSRAREFIELGLATRRPWMEMIHLQNLSFPTSFTQLIYRIKNNTDFFCTNYILIILFIFLLALLWHPIPLLLFIITFVAWLFLYFLRDEPLVVRGSTVDDRLVTVVLTLITIALPFVTHTTKNIIASLFIGTMVVLMHAAVRGRSEDAFFTDEEDLLESAGGRDVTKMPLKHAASSSFSLP